jgi:crossover junction endodeoxyribonuclease RusA
MAVAAFSVEGAPIPKGSTRAFIPKGWKRPVITAASPKTKAWEQKVRRRAEEQGYSEQPGAFRVVLKFVLPRPKRLRSCPKHITRPDVDKLSRCILDALTGIVWRDDSQVVALRATKRYARPDESPRVDVWFSKLDGL